MHTVKQFRSLLFTANILFAYFFIKAYVVGTHLNCIHLFIQITTHNRCFYEDK